MIEIIIIEDNEIKKCSNELINLDGEWISKESFKTNITGLDFAMLADWLNNKPLKNPSLAFTDSLNRRVAEIIYDEYNFIQVNKK